MSSMAHAAACGGMDDVPSSADVLQAISELRPEHRDALIEVWYRKRPVAEAARRLGVPTHTVKVRVYYALRALRLALDEGRESVR
jgi:RNA polymerase sigma-70 factor (ECF subfamily)